MALESVMLNQNLEESAILTDIEEYERFKNNFVILQYRLQNKILEIGKIELCPQSSLLIAAIKEIIKFDNPRVSVFPNQIHFNYSIKNYLREKVVPGVTLITYLSKMGYELSVEEENFDINKPRFVYHTQF